MGTLRVPAVRPDTLTLLILGMTKINRRRTSEKEGFLSVDGNF